MLALAAVLLGGGAVELALRVVGFGHPTTFFIRDEAPGVYRTNPAFTASYLPRSLGLKPVNFRLAREKPADAVRVFVLGESAAMGQPEPGFALAPQLQAQLRAAYPDRRIEVFNLAVMGINSHAIVRIAEEALEFGPDLLVLYVGNNEVVGPFGPGPGDCALPSRWRIRAALAARSTRIGQWIETLAGRFRGRDNDPEWRGLASPGAAEVRPDDPRLERVYQRFDDNVAAVLDAAQAEDVAVVLSTVAVNQSDCAPFASTADPKLTSAQRAEWSVARAAALAALDREDDVAAREALERAVALDGQHAETRFQLARVLARRGAGREARQEEAAALEWDVLRFRADARINGILRAQAERRREQGARLSLVDAAAAMRSGGNGAGAAYFFDHVHLTWEGHLVLARALAEAAARWVPGAATGAWLGPEECATALGFTPIARLMMVNAVQDLTARAPFTRQYTYGRDRSRRQWAIARLRAALTEPPAAAAAAQAVEEALSRDPDNLWLGAHAVLIRAQQGNPAGALALLEEVGAREPTSAELLVKRAVLLQQLGRPEPAEEAMVTAVELDPYYLPTYELLGRHWLATEQVEKGQAFFQEQLERRPGSVTLRHVIARLHAAASEWPAAEAQWEAILAVQPDDEVALEGLLRRLFSSGRTEEAVARMQAAFDYNPRNFANNARLVQFHETHQNTEEQLRCMAALGESGLVPPGLHLERAAILQRLGRPDEMRAALRAARRVAREEGDAALVEELGRRLGERTGPARP